MMTLEDISDEELVRRFLAGDRNCFAVIFSRHQDKVFKVAMRIVRNHSDAEDLVQDIFVQVFKKLASFKFECQFSSWLYKVSSNLCLMQLRTQKRRGLMFIEDLEPSKAEVVVESRGNNTNMNHLTYGHEIRNMLTDAINSIPEQYRTVFVLNHIDGMSCGEISENLSITLSASRNRLHAARTHMRDAVSGYMQQSCDEAA